MDSVIVALPSIHDILHVESRLKSSRVRFDIIPTPTAISTDCGMVIETSESSLAVVLQEIDAAEIPVVRLFCRKNGQYEPMVNSKS